MSDELETKSPAYSNRTCGQCCHWFKVSLGLEIQRIPTGQCRESPPSAQMINAQQNVALYPLLPANFGACSKFKSQLSLEFDEEAQIRKA